MVDQTLLARRSNCRQASSRSMWSPGEVTFMIDSCIALTLLAVLPVSSGPGWVAASFDAP
ncbi:hypothetical protein DOTSEDRAFT_44583 [Dothistroma septosporum NZE10]|uniref:Uncharacterized protein n=1 Tax=Dothistroma septosporum (strain NZE10 / CBS 128990) TaxID=675120 RepID=N1PPM6_DOTSN|nr:hypothetical protein DOTSEDRAFT_44583 [Dothistroma septosporum NZE10]